MHKWDSTDLTLLVLGFRVAHGEQAGRRHLLGQQGKDVAEGMQDSIWDQGLGVTQVHWDSPN